VAHLTTVPARPDVTENTTRKSYLASGLLPSASMTGSAEMHPLTGRRSLPLVDKIYTGAELRAGPS